MELLYIDLPSWQITGFVVSRKKNSPVLNTIELRRLGIGLEEQVKGLTCSPILTMADGEGFSASSCRLIMTTIFEG